MISFLIVFAYAVVLLVLGLLYLMQRYHISWADFKDSAMRHKRSGALYALAACAIIWVGILFCLRHDEGQTLLLARWVTVLIGLTVMSITDIHEKIIPNRLILILAGVRLCFLAIEVAAVPEFTKQAILFPLLGGLIGGWVLLAARLLSKKGAGMGDTKMFTVIGFYVGSTEIFSVMFWCFCVTAVVGVFLLITKKAKANDTIPMAPFALLGTLIKFASVAVGG